jgi:tetratricopeptide (TPR) repeat protein
VPQQRGERVALFTSLIRHRKLCLLPTAYCLLPVSLWFVIAAIIVFTAAPQLNAVAPARTGLTAAPQLALVYDAILDARFEDVPGLLEDACPPAPREACLLLDAVATWWWIQLDPHDTSRDRLFQARVETAIAAAEAWTRREPDRAEAWFYLGGAYGARVQWRVLRHQQLAAARDGKRINDALERALMLDPGMEDAYFGIGLYHYYADVAPAAAKVVRWLLALPGGDRVKGLEELLRARGRGQLLRGEADYQLHVLNLWYEKQPDEALALLRGLRTRHPRNPHFIQAAAEIEDHYLHDPTASLRTYEAMLIAAHAGRLAEPVLATTVGRLGIARQLDQLFETDKAVEYLRAIVNGQPPVPHGALAQAQLQLGQALDRLGSRAEAMAAYRAAIAATPPDDPLTITERAQAGLRRTPDPQRARAYRRSLEGWRALERGELDDASRAIAESLALGPGDPVTEYRQATLLLAQQQDEEALVVFAEIHKRHEETPPTFYTRACVDAARVHERLGAAQIAIDLYRSATTVYGGDRRAKDAARRQLARLTASTR